MRRLPGIAFGLSTQVFFLATLPFFFFFLRNDYAAAPPGPLWIDALLAVGFGLPHSVMLFPPTRRFLTRFFPSELYGCLFCLATCASLWLTFVLWRGSPTVIWAWPERVQPLVALGHLGCWGLLFYSLYLSGLQYQTGLGPWWNWVRRRPLPRREFHPKGAFRHVRHPVYLSVLGLVWVTPIVTADRAVLIAVWTAYIFVGSYLKDRRLARILGPQYTRYMDKVPAYPLLTWRLPEPSGATVR